MKAVIPYRKLVPVQYNRMVHHHVVLCGLFLVTIVSVCVPAFSPHAQYVQLMTNILWLWEPDA